jgi:hypothetical protein
MISTGSTCAAGVTLFGTMTHSSGSVIAKVGNVTDLLLRNASNSQ